MIALLIILIVLASMAFVFSVAFAATDFLDGEGGRAVSETVNAIIFALAVVVASLVLAGAS